VFDIAEKSCIGCVRDHYGSVYGLSIHPKRPFFLVSSSSDNTIRYWHDDICGAIRTKMMLGPSYSDYFTENINNDIMMLDASKWISLSSSKTAVRSDSPTQSSSTSPLPKTLSSSCSLGELPSSLPSSFLFFPSYQSLSKLKMYGYESRKLFSELNFSQLKSTNSITSSLTNKSSNSMSIAQLISYYKKVGDFFYPPVGITQIWELLEQGFFYYIVFTY
jgi:hypothetical protein